MTPNKYKNITLLVFSLLFYAWGEPKIVFCMIATIVVSYILGVLTDKYPDKKKAFLWIAVICSLGSLGYFKYADFFITNFNHIAGMSVPLLKIALPVGISFYTFQVLSYNIDVYRGTVKAQKNIINLAAYIAMFPQLIAGPIVRYQDIETQLTNRVYTADRFAYGIRRFVVGLSKKVLIANQLGELCMLYTAATEPSVLFSWMYAVAFSLQIYFDFSGYSDMAIGLGKILGYDFPENFNYPYISRSITEFWRRWHISLGSWFRDYVYIPLGGSKVNTKRMYMNILHVWMLTGLWHGAAWNFVVWGLYFAVLLIMEKTFLLQCINKYKKLGHIYVILTVVISFVIFNASSMSAAWTDICRMFGCGGIPVTSAESIYYLKSYAFVLMIAVIGATPLPKLTMLSMRGISTDTNWYQKVSVLSMKGPVIDNIDSNQLTMMSEKGAAADNIEGGMHWLLYLEPVFCITLVIVVTAYLIDGSFNPFLYFRF